MTDLSYLAALGREHVLVSARLGINLDLRGGLLAKLLFWAGRTRLVFLNPGADGQLSGVLARFLAGRIVEPGDRSAATFDLREPVLLPADWDAVTDADGVLQVAALASTNAISIELRLPAMTVPMIIAPGAASRLHASLAAAAAGREGQGPAPGGRA